MVLNGIQSISPGPGTGSHSQMQQNSNVTLLWLQDKKKVHCTLFHSLSSSPSQISRLSWLGRVRKRDSPVNGAAQERGDSGIGWVHQSTQGRCRQYSETWGSLGLPFPPTPQAFPSDRTQARATTLHSTMSSLRIKFFLSSFAFKKQLRDGIAQPRTGRYAQEVSKDRMH